MRLAAGGRELRVSRALGMEWSEAGYRCCYEMNIDFGRALRLSIWVVSGERLPPAEDGVGLGIRATL